MNPNSHSKESIQPLRSRLKEVTKQAILEAAEEAFGEQGVHASRMEDIASRAGTAVGTLYNYFGDRQAVIDTLIDTRRAELVAKVEEAIHGTKGRPFEERLARYLQTVVDHFVAHRRLFALLLEEETSRERAREGKRSSIRESLKRAEALVQDGLKSGAIRREDAEMFPTFVVGMVHAVFFCSIHGGAPIPGDVGPLVRFFMDGARSHKP